MASIPAPLHAVLDLILPPRCPGCGEVTPAPLRFCATCWASLHFITPPWCAACNRPFAIERSLCGDCLKAAPAYDGVRAAVAYGPVARRVALRLKYARQIGLADLIATQLARHLPDDGVRSLIVPVPLHWSRLWQRGYNQSVLIGRALLRHGDHDMAPDLLRRVKRTRALGRLSSRARARILSGAIRIDTRQGGRVAGRRVLLIDDVLTTGATASACARVLKRAGADEVIVLCWARVLESGVT